MKNLEKLLLLHAITLISTHLCSAFLQPSSACGLRTYLHSEPPIESDASESDDPRVFQQKIREAQLAAIVNPRKELVRKRKQGEAASKSMDLPMQPLVKTISGGANLIFEATRMDVPRWHPTAGVSDVNPSFRIESPSMNSQGYAASIWRNARKNRQPAMWRYALRTFDRLIAQSQQQQTAKGPKVEITNLHYEGALVAAAKLGWSDRALEIYRVVEQKEAKILERLQQQPGKSKKIAVRITDNMVLSVIRACVREAVSQNTRLPLDAALQIAETVEDSHQIPVTAIHLNPIAAAYQAMGLTEEANQLLRKNLGERIGGPEAENVFLDHSFNVYDVQAKDKGSYALLVSSAVTEQDWGGAIDALKTMTEAGVYPANRHLNAWTEISERQRQHRFARSWKKKRDAALADRSIQAALQDVEESSRQ